jgi:hypothetical protein
MPNSNENLLGEFWAGGQKYHAGCCHVVNRLKKRKSRSKKRE